jgi:cell division topological specificity factor
MTLLGLFRRRRAAAPAETARERLGFLVAHERVDRAAPDYLPQVKREILEVLAKHIQVGGDEVEVRLSRGVEATVIEVSVVLPTPQAAAASAPPSLRVEPAFAQ